MNLFHQWSVRGNRWLLNGVLVLLLLMSVSYQSAQGAKSDVRKDMPMNLLPMPKSITAGQGEFVITGETRIFIPEGIERPEWLACLRLRDTVEQAAGIRLTLDRLGLQPAPSKGIFLSVKLTPETDPIRMDGYFLQIDQEAIRLTGNSSSGLFYGIQTLIQLARQAAPKLPALVIEDEPDFIHRGFYHDICRGKVPKLETLKWLVDQLAEMKINQFQLYVEHTFAFRFDPDIAQDCSPIEPDEILELDQYCRDRRIDFVPSIQSFGHMGHILSLPQYRHLADVEMTKSWEEMTWYDRMMGATLNPTDPEALQLLENMYDNFLPLFESNYVNVCSDETYDLGKGKNEQLAEEIGKGRLYLNHIHTLNDLSKRYGKRMMFWGDIVKQHPDLVPEIPKDAILLNWGYAANTDYESTKLFADAGLDLFVCPGTSGWNRILNGINNADLNIRRYADAGKRYGALGLLNTDWGDYGHYNLLAGSLHGIALGAAMAWHVGFPEQEDFDRILSAMLFEDAGESIEALRKQAWVGDRVGSWIMYYEPFENLDALKSVSDEQAKDLIRQARDAAKVFKRNMDKGRGLEWVNDELRQISLTNALLGEKILLARQLAENEGKRNRTLARKLDDFAKEVESLYEEYEVLWRARNKESNLRDIRKKIEELIQDARQHAKQVMG